MLSLKFVFFLTLAAAVISHPTVYVKNDQDRLSAVLVPVSSTVIPLPIYKVSYSLGGSSDEPTDINKENVKLITAKSQKSKKGKVKAAVKPISREYFEKKL